jgi:hypothetical protein
VKLELEAGHPKGRGGNHATSPIMTVKNGEPLTLYELVPSKGSWGDFWCIGGGGRSGSGKAL